MLTTDQATSYVAGLFEALGDRDPLEVLRERDAALRALVDGLPDNALRRPEAPGKWSIATVVQHLADSELVVGWRLRMILSHDEPAIEAYDQDLWSSRLHYNDADLDDALLQARVLRDANLKLIAHFTPEELRTRAGIHAERGRETAWRVLELLAAHDLVHRRQIARIRGS